MNADLSFFSLISGASIVVQLVMLLLLSVSVLSWTMIFRKRGALNEARVSAEKFEDRFWSGGDLATLYQQLAPRAEELTGLANIFVSGFTEFTRLRRRGGGDPMAMVEGAQRCMRVALSRAGEDVTKSGHRPALQLFAFSIFYLFALFATLLIEHLAGLAP